MFEDFNKDSRENDIEKYESLRRSKERKNYLLKKFMGLKEFEEPDFNKVKKKVENLVDEFANLMGSLEKRKPEDTADHYVEFYFPVIEEIRQSKNYRDVSNALEKIEISKVINRFFELTKKFGILMKTTKSPFPQDVDVYKEFVNMQTTFSLIAGYEEIILENS